MTFAPHLRRALDESQIVPDPADLPQSILHALARASHLETFGMTVLPEDEGDEREERSFAQLADSVWRLAARFDAYGIDPGERVLLVQPTGLDFIESFLALQLIGAVPVPAYPPAALQTAEVALDRLRHIVENAGIRVCLTSKELSPLLRAITGFGRRAVSRLVTTEDLPRADASLLRPRVGDVAFIQYTSGSTGRPKGVVIEHSALIANLQAGGEASKVTRHDKMVSWLPLYHDMGLISGFLWPIHWQIPCVLMSPMAFLAKPERWLQAISDFGGTLSCAPNFAYARCAKRVSKKQKAQLDLSGWRIALNGAEPVNAATVASFNEAFAECGLQPTTLYPCYGMAESVVAVTFSEPGTEARFERLDRDALAEGRVERSNHDDALEIACVGSAVPSHEVFVVDESGARLPDRAIGEVVVRGPSLMRGYLDNEEASAEALRDGTLFTGDLGFTDQGDLYVTGRKKDLIIVRGKNVHAEDVEVVVEGFDGVRKGRVVAFGVYDEARAMDRVVIALEGGPSDEAGRAALSEEIRARVGEVIGLGVDDVAFLPPRSIPKTYSGKRQRQLAKRRYLAGTLGKRDRLSLARVALRAAAGFAFVAGASLFA